MKVYYKGGFMFIELGEEIWKQLQTFETNRFVVNKETSSFIYNTLSLNILTNEEVRGVRNEIVSKYEDKFVNEKFSIRENRMSMIVAVIDGELYRRGLMY